MEYNKILISIFKSQVKSKKKCRESLQNFVKLADDFDVSMTEFTSESGQITSHNDLQITPSSVQNSEQNGNTNAILISVPNQEVKVILFIFIC